MICSGGRGFEPHRAQRFFSLSLHGPISFLGLMLSRNYLGLSEHFNLSLLNLNICLIVLGQTLLVTPSLTCNKLPACLQYILRLHVVLKENKRTGLSEPVARHFNLPDLLHEHMKICRISLLQNLHGKSSSPFTLNTTQLRCFLQDSDSLMILPCKDVKLEG